MKLKQYREQFNNIYDEEFTKNFYALNEVLPNNPYRIVSLPISKELFFIISEFITLKSNGVYLTGKVDKLHKGSSYISYYEQNNNFSKPPKNQITENDLGDNISITIDLKTDTSLTIVPILIMYKNGSKMKTSRLTYKYNKIDTKEYDQFRVTFKTSGYGQFILKSIRVRML